MIENYDSIAHIIGCAKNENKKISQLVLEQQAVFMELSEKEIFNLMDESYKVMEQSIEGGLEKDVKSASGLTGGDAFKMMEYIKKGNTLTGETVANSLMAAIAVSEFNASMGKIVASPTAGSCGILPSVLSVIQKSRNIDREDIIMSLFTASGVGMVIANNASLAGAEGGCQAECGSAAAMAAAAAVELCGGTPDMVSSSVGIALQNIMGLVCD
ncbi:MAG: L-serine ammonia-lyase, iron-sulfur-dependent, subunit alpha, partial [Oscillospiraceae bacterium]